jgi:peptide/nickel transport system permease protein
VTESTSPAAQSASDEIRDDAEATDLSLGASDRPVAQARRRGVLPMILKPGFLAAGLLLLIVLFCAFAPGAVATYDPIAVNAANALQAPSWIHWFGTDELGRDVLTRMIYGTGLSLRTTLVAVAIGIFFGGLIGLISGFLGGQVDNLIMRVVDVLLSIPTLLLAMALITALGFGQVQLSVAVGIGLIGSASRVMRSEVLRVRSATFIDAERSLGAPTWYILLRHVLPNSAGPVFVLTIIEFGQAILAIAALSFLGFGTPPPTPEWGSIVAAGQRYLASAWWITVLPGLMIALVVVSINRVARAMESNER